MFDFSDDAHELAGEIDRLVNDATDSIERHQPLEAMVSARSAIRIAEEHALVMPIDAMLHLGYALSDLYENQTALDCYALARDRFVVDGDGQGIAHVDMNVAIVLTQLDRHGEAVELLEQASAAFAESGPADELNACQVNLTSALLGAGRVGEAAEVGRQAVAAARTSGDGRRLPDALTNTANAERELGNHEAARCAYIEALELYRKLDLPTEEADCLNSLGVIARLDGLFDFAASMHAKAIEMYEGRDHHVDQAIARYNLAVTDLWRGNFGAALREAMLASDAPVTALDPAFVVAAALDGLGRRAEASTARAGFVERQGEDGAEKEAALLPCR